MSTKGKSWNPAPRTAFLIVAGAVAAGLAIRLAFWLQLCAGDIRVLLFTESMDSKIYHAWAERIAGGDILLGDGLFTLSPYYSYLLAPVYAVAGCDMFAAILVQLVLGAATIAVMYAAGSLVFGRAAGILAAGMTAFYGHFVLTEGLLLSEAFLPLLTALFILWTARSLERGRPRPFVVSGLLLGALFSIRPQYFLVVILLPLCGLAVPYLRSRIKRHRNESGGLGITAAVLAWGALGAALVVAPLGIRNLVVSGRPVLLTISGGVNFYIGNNPEATGTWWIPEKIVPPGARMDQKGMFDAFARAAGSETYEARHSAHWFGRGLDHIGGDTGGWLRLTAKKAALFWNNYEIPVNFDFAFFRQHLGAARFGFVPFCAVGSLGLLGLWLAVRRKRALWLTLVTAGLFGGTIAFFVCARYRVAAVPYLILFASYGLAWIIDTIRGREWKRLAGPAGIVAGGLVLAFLSFPFQDLRTHTADQYRNMWYHFFQQGDLPRAEKWIRAAVEHEPEDPGLKGDLGMTLHRAGRYSEAAECLRKALEGMPGHPILEKALEDALKRAQNSDPTR